MNSSLKEDKQAEDPAKILREEISFVAVVKNICLTLPSTLILRRNTMDDNLKEP